MDMHDLILILASGFAGFALRYLLESWAEQRAKPYRDSCEKATQYAMQCQLNEAYRAGQESVGVQFIEAPAPTDWH